MDAGTLWQARCAQLLKDHVIVQGISNPSLLVQRGEMVRECSVLQVRWKVECTGKSTFRRQHAGIRPMVGPRWRRHKARSCDPCSKEPGIGGALAGAKPLMRSNCLSLDDRLDLCLLAGSLTRGMKKPTTKYVTAFKRVGDNGTRKSRSGMAVMRRITLDQARMLRAKNHRTLQRRVGVRIQRAAQILIPYAGRQGNAG